MKLTKRILAMALALMMVLSLSVGAMAAGVHSHTITISNPSDNYEYVAYQIFAGTLNADGVLSDITWGEGVNGPALEAAILADPDFAGCTNVKEIAAKLAGNTSKDAPLTIKFADIVAQHLVSGKGHKSSAYDSAQQKYYINGLADGYYLVLNTKVPANAAYTRHIVEVVRNVTVTHKGDIPTVDKKILDPTPVVTNEASIGEAVNYQITGTMPSNIADYDTYYYQFVDTLSKGLTYKADSMVITVNGVNVTEYFWKNSTVNADGTTSIKVTIKDLIALKNLTTPAVGAITSNTTVVVTYSATVNENAVIAGSGNPNEVHLVYSNDPNQDGEGSTTPPPPPGEEPEKPTVVGITPKKEVKTYVTELTIKKIDGAGKPLTGAEFTLEGDGVKVVLIYKEEFVVAGAGETATWYELKDGTFTEVPPVTGADSNEDEYKNPAAPTHVMKHVYETKDETLDTKVVAEVGANGFITFTGLGAGTYTLTETKTPSGFNTISPIHFTISFDPVTAKFSSNNTDIRVEADNTLRTDIVNTAGTVLPSTGGMGTTLFYIFDGLLFVGAAVLLVTKKRMAM